MMDHPLEGVYLRYYILENYKNVVSNVHALKPLGVVHVACF